MVWISPYGVNSVIHMGDISIFKESDDMTDERRFPDVAQEFVA